MSATPALATAPAGLAEPTVKARLRVLLVDDHQMVRQALASLLNAEPDMQVIGEAADGHKAVRQALELRPHVIVMDISMPEMNGIDATASVTSQLPNVRVVAVSMHDSQDVAVRALAAGASAFITKDQAAQQLIALIRRCAVHGVAEE